MVRAESAVALREALVDGERRLRIDSRYGFRFGVVTSLVSVGLERVRLLKI